MLSLYKHVMLILIVVTAAHVSAFFKFHSRDLKGSKLKLYDARKFVLPGVITALIVMNLQTTMPCRADLDDFEAPAKEASTNQFDFVYSSTRSEAMQKKLKSVEAVNIDTSASTAADGDKYKASLAKERAKADALSKKSKADRRRDLCEELGRGC